MNQMNVLTLIAKLLVLGLAAQSNDVLSQKTLDEQLAGAWTYVAVDTVRTDGSRTPMYGPDPHGLMIFDGHGRYALVNSRADLPKYGSNDRMKGTADEYKATVQGSIAHFGTYRINEADKTITFDIDTSTYPNWTPPVRVWLLVPGIDSGPVCLAFGRPGGAHER